MKRWIGFGRLKRRLLAYVIIALAPLVILDTLAQNAAWRARRDAILSDSMDVATGTATGVDSYLGNIQALEHAAAASLAADVVSPDKATNYLKRLRTDDPHLLSIIVVNPEGRVIYADMPDHLNRNVTGRRWFRDISSGDREDVGNVFEIRKAGRKAFTVSVGEWHSGRLKLVFSAVIDTGALVNLVSDADSRDTHVSIVDARGNIVATNEPAVLRREGLVNRSGLSIIRNALNGRRGVATDWWDPLHGDLEIGAAAPVSRVGWAVSVMQPQDVAYKTVVDARRRDLLALFLFGAFSLFLAWFFGNQISGAVEKLEDSAARLAAGDLSARSDISRDDEIGRLASSFNEMGTNLEALHNAARYGGSAKDVRSVLESVSHEICKASRFDMCGFGMVDEGANEIVFAGMEGSETAAWKDLRVPLGQGMCGIAVAERRMVSGLIEEFEDDACRMLATPEGVCWAAVAPIVQGDTVVAVLAAYSRTESDMPERDVRLLSTMASLAAAGVQNVAVHQRERRIAETLQRSFLPDIPTGVGKFEVAHLYHPALKEAEVGGDFYDFFPISSSCSGIVIGDVAGKGLSAAVDAVMSKYMLRAFVTQDHDPTTVLGRLNDALAATVPSSSFITMAYGALDLDELTFSFACAGQEPPILYRSAERDAIFFKPAGRALAVEAGETYEAVEVKFQPGDCLLLYTDGISEARRGREMFRDVELLRAVVTCWRSGGGPETLKAFFEQVMDYAGGEIRDDIAMLAIRRFV